VRGGIIHKDDMPGHGSLIQYKSDFRISRLSVRVSALFCVTCEVVTGMSDKIEDFTPETSDCLSIFCTQNVYMVLSNV
jgi:hypothetical protein